MRLACQKYAGHFGGGLGFSLQGVGLEEEAWLSRKSRAAAESIYSLWGEEIMYLDYKWRNGVT